MRTKTIRCPSRTTTFAALCLFFLSLTACPGELPPDGEPEAEASGPQLENGSFTAELNGFPIHYEVHGLGSVMMVVTNSWGLSLEGVRGLFRPLEQHLTLVYFDPRGMGESGAIREDSDMGMAAVREDFDALRRHLELERVHAIGWSNGATNLIQLASEKLETLRSAIFVHTAPRFGAEDGAKIQEEYAELVARSNELRQRLLDDAVPDEEKEALQRKLFLEDWFPQLFADPEAGREALPEIFGDADFSYRHGLYANQEMPTYDLRDRLGDITVPSLVIAGAHDLLPTERTEELHAGIPDSRFVVFENSGHFAMREEPGKWQKVVLDFIAQVERDAKEEEERKEAGEER